MSDSQRGSSVKEVSGKSTTTHIAERIIGEARALLQHTDWNISEIAYALGFEYPTYFNNFFKKKNGRYTKIHTGRPFLIIILFPFFSLTFFGAYVHLCSLIEQFGITTTIVNPGFFRTELLTEESTKYTENTISDYDEARKQQLQFWKGANGQQTSDPEKLAQCIDKDHRPRKSSQTVFGRCRCCWNSRTGNINA